MDPATTDKICCYNRHYAEHSGYWTSTAFLSETGTPTGEVTFYDSISRKPLFVAPRGRSWADFVRESRSHGWPSFRDEEVITDSVRVLKNGEAVSVDGTHLGKRLDFFTTPSPAFLRRHRPLIVADRLTPTSIGHNLPDRAGNRYCINLVSVAGLPPNEPGDL